jgi:hypothetical protein
MSQGMQAQWGWRGWLWVLTMTMAMAIACRTPFVAVGGLGIHTSVYQLDLLSIDQYDRRHLLLARPTH